MNNINQKNEIYAQKRYSGLPYKYPENIHYGYSQNINSTIFNNTLQQLLDNDLYTENAIRDYSTSQVGPKTPDYDIVYNAYDGYKVLSDDGTNFFVLRKEEERFGKQISCLIENQDIRFSFIFKNTLFLGTSYSLQYFDINGNLVELLPYGSNGYFVLDNTVFFATNGGAFAMKSAGEFTVDQQHELEKVDKDADYVAKSVFYDMNSKSLFVGTDEGIYECYVDVSQADNNFEELQLEYIPMKDGENSDDIHQSVNKFQVNGESVIAGTDDGVFKNETTLEYKNYKAVLNGMQCKFQAGWNEKLYIVASDGSEDILYEFNEKYTNRVELGRFQSITCMETGDYLYVVSNEGVFQFDGRNFQKCLIPIQGITKIVPFNVNGKWQMLASTVDSIYHVGYQYDTIAIDRLEDETVTCMTLVGENRLYVGTDRRLYSYFLQIGHTTRETSRINDFKEVKGVLTKEVSAIIGTLDVEGKIIAYTGNIVYDVTDKDGKQYVEESGKIIKVVSVGNNIIIVRKNGLRALDTSLVASQTIIFGEIPNETIADATSTDNLVVVITQEGNVYKYQVTSATSDERPPQQLNLNNVKASKIASYRNIAAVKLENSSQITYFQENKLPTLIYNSATNINKIKYGDGQELVYASMNDGLVLSSDIIAQENSGNPIVLESGIPSYDSIEIEGILYNCTDRGVYAHELVTNENGKTVGVSDTTTHYLEDHIINGAIEHDGILVVGGSGGIFALSSIVSYEEYDGVDVQDKSDSFIDIAFFNGKRCFISKDEEYIFLQEEDIEPEYSFPFDSEINDTCQVDINGNTEYCIATDNGFYVLRQQGTSYNLQHFSDDDIQAKSLVKVGSVVFVVDNMGHIYTYDGENALNQDNKYVMDNVNVQSYIDSAVIDNLIYFLFIEDTTGKKNIAVCLIDDDGKTLKSAELVEIQNNKIFDIEKSIEIFKESGNIFIRSQETEDDGKIYKFQQLKNGRALKCVGIASENITERVPCESARLYRNDKGIISLYNSMENVLDVETDATAIAFMDQNEYGLGSGCFFLKTVEANTEIKNTNFTKRFISLAQDTTRDTQYVRYIGKQFGIVILILEISTGYTMYQKPSSVWDIGNIQKYKQLFDKKLVLFDFGFSYIEQTKTAYVFSRNLIYSWGASSQDSLIGNANLYSYQDIMDINTDMRQMIYVNSGNRCLMDVLKVDYDQSGIAYISRNGIYTKDSDSQETSLFKMKYQDQNVGNMFSSRIGIIFQKKTPPYRLMINTDGMQSSILNIGNQEGQNIPSGVRNVCEVGRNIISQLENGRWFYYLNEQRMDIQRSDIVGFHPDATIGFFDIENRDIAISKDKVFVVEYGLIDGCDVLDKQEFYSGSILSKHTVGGRLLFTTSNFINNDYAVIDGMGNEIILNIGERTSSRFDGIVPVDDSDGKYFIFHFGKQFLVSPEGFKKLEVQLDYPMNSAYCVGNQIAAFSDDKIEVFDDYGEVNVFYRVDMSHIQVFDILKVKDFNFVLCTNDGLYRYAEDSIYKISDVGKVYSLVYHELDGTGKYITGLGRNVLVSRNCKKWDEMFAVTEKETQINDIYVKNRMEYFISTSKGLYKTMYSYKLVNDYDNRNEFEMREFVQSLSSELESTFYTNMQKHERIYHAPDTDIEKINQTTISVNMEKPGKDWCSINDDGQEYIVDNDIVYSTDFGDSQSGVLRVDLDSYLGQAYNVGAEYIQKNYVGGMTELFIHVDTTNNYYMNYMYGTPNCTIEQSKEKRTRRNLESTPSIDKSLRFQDSDPSSHYTTVKLTLNKQVFDIRQVLEVEINGCSLPLKIYKDTISPINQNANNMFGGLMLPSLVGGYDISGQEDHTFTFMCFGTDEQSIRISFIGDSQNTEGKFVTVQFNSNGGKGSTPSQKILLDTTVKLRPNLFTRKDFSFSGWSMYVAGINQKPMFKDEQEIVFSSDTYTPDTTVTFYAVWSTQEESDQGGGEEDQYSDGSQILLNTEQNEQIQIVYTEDGEAVFQVTNV